MKRATTRAEVVKYGEDWIDVHRRPRQRHMHLTVQPNGRIRVTCNLRRTSAEILSFVDSCGRFIDRRRSELAEINRRYPLRKFVSGEEFLFLGRRLRLDLIWSWHRRARAKFCDEVIEILAPVGCSGEDRLNALIECYRSEARKWLGSRLSFFAGLMGLTPTRLTIRGQRTLWGSCSGEGAISLNWKLMACPADVIDYVIVHELSHIPHRNHGPGFWRLVARFDPDYKRHRQWLKEHETEIGRMFMAAEEASTSEDHCTPAQMAFEL